MHSVSSRDTNKRLSSSNDELRVALKVRYLFTNFKVYYSGVQAIHGTDSAFILIFVGIREFLKGFLKFHMVISPVIRIYYHLTSFGILELLGYKKFNTFQILGLSLRLDQVKLHVCN